MTKNFLRRNVTFVFIVILVFISCVAKAETTNLVDRCSWTPTKPHSVESLQTIKKIDYANNLLERDKDYLRVVEKGRLYFHSLPNEVCRSETFIIKGDTVQIIDSFPANDLSFNNEYARVIFYSKKLNSDIIGWVKMTSLKRLTRSEIQKIN